VPNPNAQAKVIERALREAGVDARAVSYVEAHGTGTSLGDPIEIAGLSKAFGQWTQDASSARSVRPNRISVTAKARRVSPA
jgi:acyl transferase domain-containing protein